MSDENPAPEAPAPAAGPRPPKRRTGSKFAGAGKNATRVTAADAPEQVAPAPEPPADGTEVVPEESNVQSPAPEVEKPAEAPSDSTPASGGLSGTAEPSDQPESSTAEKPQEPAEEAAPGKESTEPGSEAHGGNEGATEGTHVEVYIPPVTQLPDFGRLQARSASRMDPAQQAMFTRSLEVEFMQVTSSYRAMMKRQDDLTKQVQMARSAGYPDAELERLAIKHGWEVPDTPS